MWIIGGHNLKRKDIKIGKDIIDVIYPIGFVYISINNINPSTLFGGMWEQIKGRFLLAAGENEANTTTDFGSMSAGELNRPVGELGGEATHTLTVDELPENIGTFRTLSWAVDNTATGAFSVTSQLADRDGPVGNSYGTAQYKLSGGGQPHNNMPPYVAVYVWKRTA